MRTAILGVFHHPLAAPSDQGDADRSAFSSATEGLLCRQVLTCGFSPTRGGAGRARTRSRARPPPGVATSAAAAGVPRAPDASAAPAPGARVVGTATRDSSARPGMPRRSPGVRVPRHLGRPRPSSRRGPGPCGRIDGFGSAGRPLLGRERGHGRLQGTTALTGSGRGRQSTNGRRPRCTWGTQRSSPRSLAGQRWVIE
jgi:hypothetical protein